MKCIKHTSKELNQFHHGLKKEGGGEGEYVNTHKQTDNCSEKDLGFR